MLQKGDKLWFIMSLIIDNKCLTLFASVCTCIYLATIFFPIVFSLSMCPNTQIEECLFVMDEYKYTYWLIWSQIITIEWIAVNQSYNSLVLFSDVWGKWIGFTCWVECSKKKKKCKLKTFNEMEMLFCVYCSFGGILKLKHFDQILWKKRSMISQSLCSMVTMEHWHHLLDKTEVNNGCQCWRQIEEAFICPLA